MMIRANREEGISENVGSQSIFKKDRMVSGVKCCRALL